MKAIMVTILLAATFAAAKAQQKFPKMFSLQPYAPSISVQDGKNCFAYAGAYVMMTTEEHFKTRTVPDSNTSYSFGFVDGVIQHLKNKLGTARFNKLVDDSVYHSSGQQMGNLDYVFYVLKYYGTVPFRQFPYSTKKAIKKHFDTAMLKRSDLHKIKDITELYSCKPPISEQLTDRIKASLLEGKPVVCSIHQEEGLCEWEKLSEYKPTEECMGNHIITIIGYNEDRFIIKNNYDRECVHEYTMGQIYKMLKWAYTYQY